MRTFGGFEQCVSDEKLEFTKGSGTTALRNGLRTTAALIQNSPDMGYERTSDKGHVI
jgi:hypothetical protein